MQSSSTSNSSPSDDSRDVQQIRQSWAKESDIDLRCDMQFLDLPKLSTRNKNKSPKSDQNGNKAQDYVKIPPDNKDAADVFDKQNRNLPLENNRLRYSSLTASPNILENNNDIMSTIQAITETGLFPNHLMSVQQTLDSVNLCPVMDRSKMEQLKDRMITNTENNLGSFYNVMQYTRQLQSKGLVHWAAGIRRDIWTVLGKPEEQNGTNRRAPVFNHSGGIEGVRTRSRMNQMTKDIIKNTIQDSHDNINHTDGDEHDDEGTWYRKPKMENETKDQSILKESLEREIAPSLDETLFTTLGAITRNTFTSLASTISAVAGYDSATNTNAALQEDINKVANTVDRLVHDVTNEEKIANCPMCEVSMKMEALLIHAYNCEGKK